MTTKKATCAIEGCNSRALWTVQNQGERRQVCRRCMEEMVAIFGWNLVRAVYNVETVVAT